MKSRSIRKAGAVERCRTSKSEQTVTQRCGRVTIQVRDREIDKLIQRGFLSAEKLNDAHEIREAIYAHLDRTLGSLDDA